LSADHDKELANACFDLARATKWVQKPIDTADLRAFAGKLVAIAERYVSEPLEIDIPLITRAVRYLGQIHAIPPMEEDTRWFSDMLQAVLEVARPNHLVDGNARRFLKDMLDGINLSLNRTRPANVG
jgi:hypothetical protein